MSNVQTAAGNVWEFSIRELLNKRIVTFRHLRNAMALPLDFATVEGERERERERGGGVGNTASSIYCGAKSESDSISLGESRSIVGGGGGRGLLRQQQQQQQQRRAYFNTLLFDPEDLRGMFNSIRLRKRTRSYFMLGASLGPILAISNPSDYIKALGILINEYDTFMTEAGSKTKKRNFFRKSKGSDDHASAMQTSYESGIFS
ncbi:hypothetical protein IWW38_004631, partial [Coemansia aciculifera]